MHDAAYGLLRLLGGSEDDSARWRALDELSRAASLEHPLQSEVLALFGQQEPSETRTLRSVLAGVPGLPLRDDPLEVLELHLQQQRELRSLLEQRQDELVRNIQRLSQLLNLCAGVAVLLFILAGLGWAMAFDWLSVVDEPSIEDVEEQEERPVPEGREERSKRP